MTISTIAQLSLAKQAEMAIRDGIINGTFAAGQRLNEVELATSLGISRAPLREALQGLSNEGLVELVPRRGARVASFQIDQVIELHEVRQALETMGASLAAVRAAKSDVHELQELVDHTRAIMSASTSHSYPVDVDLHLKILNLSGNRRLQELWHDVTLQLRLARSRSGDQPERARDALDEHQIIVRAIAAGDGPAAAEAMRAHLEASQSSVRALAPDPTPSASTKGHAS